MGASVENMHFVLLFISAFLLVACEGHFMPGTAVERQPLPPPSGETWSQNGAGTAWQEAQETQIVAPAPSTASPVTNDMNMAQKARLEQIEYELANMQRALDDVRPSIEKINATQMKLLELSETLRQIDARYGITAQQAPAQPQKAMKQASPKRKVSSPKRTNVVASAPSGQKRVENVRFGKSGNATRVVLDLGAPASFRKDLDNNEKLLVIELPGTAWATRTSGRGSGVVETLTGQQSEDGTSRLVLQLKQPIEIKRFKALPPSGPYGHRIFFDLAPL